jgi:enoyl-CoA hydratase/carnithine racemase
LRPVTICALSGSVYGGACDMAMATDFAIGTEGMEMRLSAAAVGIHYYPGGILRCVRRFGVMRAKQMFVAARSFTDQELLAMEYVQRLVPPQGLDDAVRDLIDSMRPLAPRNQLLLKRSINEVAQGCHRIEVLRQRQEESIRTDEFREGTAAFAERREPRFSKL